MVREMSIGWFVLGHGGSFLTVTWELSSLDAVSQMKALCRLGGEHLPEASVGGWQSHTEARASWLLKKWFCPPLDWTFAILSHWRLVGVSSFKEILTWPWAEGLCQNRGWRKRRRNAFQNVWGELGVAWFQGCEECSGYGKGTQGCLFTEYQRLIRGFYTVLLSVTLSLGWYSSCFIKEEV